MRHFNLYFLFAFSIFGKETLFCFFAEKPGKPDPPEIAAISDTSASLKWTPPQDDGGSPIFNYVLEYKIEGASRILYPVDKKERKKEKKNRRQQYAFSIASGILWASASAQPLLRLACDKEKIPLFEIVPLKLTGRTCREQQCGWTPSDKVTDENY